MGKQYLLGIDNGGTAVKAALYDGEGNELATAKSNVTNIMPKDGYIERDVNVVWNANAEAIRKLLAQTKIDPKEIAGISIAGYGNGAFFVDENFNPTYNAILSGDNRAKNYVKRWTTDGTEDKMLPKTNQILWAGQTTPIMAWMKDNEPAVVAKTKYIMPCVDFLRARLTGKVAAEISNISGINAMDLNTKQYDPEILALMGIDDLLDKLPARIIGSCEIGGYVTETAAAETGLATGTPVMGGLFDITSCAISTGITSSEKLCIIIGTWSINEYISQKPIASKNLFMTSFYCMDGYYLHTEGSTTSASNLQWFVDNYMREEAETMEAQGKNVYDACEEMIASIPYDDSSIVFLPFLFGTNVNLDAKAAFIGLNGRHTKAHMLRAVYEGIVFSHMYHIERLNKFRDKAATSVRISGGGSGSAEWIQMFADVLQLPIEVPKAKELGTMGVAMCAAVGIGMFPNLEEAAKVFSVVKKEYTPNPERFAYYEKKYAAYKKLLKSLDDTWGDLETLAR